MTTGFTQSDLAPLLGQHILIIGGCGGIGYAIALAAHDIGLHVTVMDLKQSIKSRDLPANMNAIDIDIRNEASIDTAFSSLDKLDLKVDHVVFASGYTADLMQISEIDTQALDDVLSGNLRGCILASRACLARMTDGAIVFLSTAIGQVGAPGYGPYAMAKAGLNALIRTLAAENAAHIRVNGIAPGPVDTTFIRGGLGRGVKDLSGAPENTPTRFDKAAFEARIPMGRLGRADDMVGPVLFLLSDSARYITGQVLHVNGGAFMRD